MPGGGGGHASLLSLVACLDGEAPDDVEYGVTALAAMCSRDAAVADEAIAAGAAPALLRLAADPRGTDGAPAGPRGDAVRTAALTTLLVAATACRARRMLVADGAVWACLQALDGRLTVARDGGPHRVALRLLIALGMDEAVLLRGVARAATYSAACRLTSSDDPVVAHLATSLSELLAGENLILGAAAHAPRTAAGAVAPPYAPRLPLDGKENVVGRGGTPVRLSTPRKAQPLAKTPPPPRWQRLSAHGGVGVSGFDAGGAATVDATTPVPTPMAIPATRNDPPTPAHATSTATPASATSPAASAFALAATTTTAGPTPTPSTAFATTTATPAPQQSELEEALTVSAEQRAHIEALERTLADEREVRRETERALEEAVAAAAAAVAPATAAAPAAPADPPAPPAWSLPTPQVEKHRLQTQQQPWTQRQQQTQRIQTTANSPAGHAATSAEGNACLSEAVAGGGSLAAAIEASASDRNEGAGVDVISALPHPVESDTATSPDISSALDQLAAIDHRLARMTQRRRPGRSSSGAGASGTSGGHTHDTATEAVAPAGSVAHTRGKASGVAGPSTAAAAEGPLVQGSVRAQGKVSAATARTRTPSVVSGELLGLATQQLSLTHALEERVTSIEGNHETMAEELERARGAFVSALSQHQLDAADADGALERAVASVFHLYALLRGTLARMSTVGTLLAPPDNSGLPAAIRATRDALAEGWDAVGAFERAAGGETGLGGADGLLFTPPSVPLDVQATELVTYTSEAAAAASL